MPGKVRGSGSVGSGTGPGRGNQEAQNGGTIISAGGFAGGSAGGSGGAGSVDELAQRAIDRLNAVRTVTVPVYSQTRGWTEDTPVIFDPNTPGEATVQSASGTQHQVNYNDDTCTCMDHRVRGNRCRHIQATHQALGEIEREYATLESPTGRIATAIDVEHAANGQRDIDTQAEAARREIQNIEEDDEFFYTDNEQAFGDYMSRASREELSYDYENALNGNQITFGLEIEFVGGNPDAIARDLYREGICGYDQQVRYHAPSVQGKWKLERDGSVSDGSGGGELVSPVLRDTPETWRNLEKICEVAKRHGAQIDYRCGGHVHMGMDPLDTARQRWRRFFRTIGGFEDVMYRVAGGTEGVVRRDYTYYARPFRTKAAQAIPNTRTLNDISDVNRLVGTLVGDVKFYGINLTNIPKNFRADTVEFRYFNGSLDHRQLQTNVKLAAGIMMASEKARTQDHHESGLFSSEAMKRRGNMLKEHSLGTNSHSDHSAVKKLVDIVFTRKKDKDAILAVYAKNQWAE